MDQLLLVLEDAAAEDALRLGLVLVLAFFVLALHDDAGGKVRDADGAFRLVDLLTAGAPGPERVDPQVLVAEIDLDFGHFGQDGDGGRAGVNASLGLGFGNPLHAVAAAFELKLLKGRFARDRKDDFLQAPQLGRAEIEDFVFPAPLVGKPLVHVEQLAREESRFVPAGAGADLHDQAAADRRVAGRGQVLQLGFRGFQLILKLVELGLGVFARP